MNHLGFLGVVLFASGLLSFYAGRAVSATSEASCSSEHQEVLTRANTRVGQTSSAIPAKAVPAVSHLDDVDSVDRSLAQELPAESGQSKAEVAVAEPSAALTELQRYWSDVYSLMTSHGGERAFRKEFGAVPVRPIGLERGSGVEDFRTTFPLVPNELLIRRSFEANQGAPSIPRDITIGAFQIIAFDVEGHLEVFPGRQVGGEPGSASTFLDDVLGSHGYRTQAAATEDQKAELLKLWTRWQAFVRGLRGRLWNVLWSVVERQVAIEGYAHNVSAVVAVNGRLVVILKGSDSELDSILDRLSENSRESRQTLEELRR